jgi:hypothetical protein
MSSSVSVEQLLRSSLKPFYAVAGASASASPSASEVEKCVEGGISQYDTLKVLEVELVERDNSYISLKESCAKESLGDITVTGGIRSSEEMEVDDRLSFSSSSTTTATQSVMEFVMDTHANILGTDPITCTSDIKSDSHMCFICYDRPADACFMECGHGNMCYQCSLVVAKKAPAQCPICRVAIAKVFKIMYFVDPDCLERILSSMRIPQARDVETGDVGDGIGDGIGDGVVGGIVRAGERLVLSEEGVMLESTTLPPVPGPVPPASE